MHKPIESQNTWSKNIQSWNIWIQNYAWEVYNKFGQQNQATGSGLHVLSTLPTAEYTFYSSVHRTFTKRDDLLDHKANLNKFKRI